MHISCCLISESGPSGLRDTRKRAQSQTCLQHRVEGLIPGTSIGSPLSNYCLRLVCVAFRYSYCCMHIQGSILINRVLWNPWMWGMHPMWEFCVAYPIVFMTRSLQVNKNALIYFDVRRFKIESAVFFSLGMERKLQKFSSPKVKGVIELSYPVRLFFLSFSS